MVEIKMRWANRCAYGCLIAPGEYASVTGIDTALPFVTCTVCYPRSWAYTGNVWQPAWGKFNCSRCRRAISGGWRAPVGSINWHTLCDQCKGWLDIQHENEQDDEGGEWKPSIVHDSIVYDSPEAAGKGGENIWLATAPPPRAWPPGKLPPYGTSVWDTLLPTPLPPTPLPLTPLPPTPLKYPFGYEGTVRLPEPPSPESTILPPLPDTGAASEWRSIKAILDEIVNTPKKPDVKPGALRIRPDWLTEGEEE